MHGFGRSTAAGVAALVATPALAHPVTGASVGAAFLHPLAGIDHLAAMLAIGAWAGIAGGHAARGLPAAFLAALLAGALAGGAGVALPGVESLIALSVLVLGLCVAAADRPPVTAATTLCALFGLAHGHAHGSELLLAGGSWRTVPAFLAASALLLGLGTLAARAAVGTPALPALRLAGLGAAATGALLLGTL